MTLTNDGRHEKAVVANSSYDFLKFVALILLPAIGSAYYAAAQIWHLPYGAEVVGTVTIVDGLLGLFVNYLSGKYKDSDEKYDGELIVDRSTNAMHVELENNDQLNALRTKAEVTFKVKPPA